MKSKIVYDGLEKYLLKNKCVFTKDYYIKYNTYFKTGGNVKFFLTPINLNEFKDLINYLNKSNLDYKIIGFTSNIIFLDEVEYSIIISTKNLSKLEINNNVVSVEAGYSLQDLVRLAVINQAKDFEGLEGIPASIAGAILMNAGAYGNNISDNLIAVDCIDENNNVVKLKKEACNFSYRNSIFKSGKYIILRATFLFKKGDPKLIAEKIEKFHIARHSYQDFVFPNLGSMISLQGNIYHHIMKDDKLFVFYFWILKYLYKNPIIKFINRKKPHNKVFNKLLSKYLVSKKGIKLNYQFSIKSANILINDGTLNSKAITNYIFLIHDLLNKKYHIENEILINPVFSINKNFEKDYQLIKEKLKDKT